MTNVGNPQNHTMHMHHTPHNEQRVEGERPHSRAALVACPRRDSLGRLVARVLHFLHTSQGRELDRNGGSRSRPDALAEAVASRLFVRVVVLAAIVLANAHDAFAAADLYHRAPLGVAAVGDVRWQVDSSS